MQRNINLIAVYVNRCMEWARREKAISGYGEVFNFASRTMTHDTVGVTKGHPTEDLGRWVGHERERSLLISHALGRVSWDMARSILHGEGVMIGRGLGSAEYAGCTVAGDIFVPLFALVGKMVIDCARNGIPLARKAEYIMDDVPSKLYHVLDFMFVCFFFKSLSLLIAYFILLPFLRNLLDTNDHMKAK